MKTLSSLILIANGINSIEKAISKYRKHPRVLLINARLKNISSFSLNEADLCKTERELNQINPRKATTLNSISPKLLKYAKNICSELL